MSSYRIEFGKWGEEVAAQYLKQRGYAILERNTRTPYGEIDIIASQKVGSMSGLNEQVNESMLVFIEVKTRSSKAYGYPEQALTSRKKENLLSSIQDYLQCHPDMDLAWRVDVISIQRTKKDKSPKITHFENALISSSNDSW